MFSRNCKMDIDDIKQCQSKQYLTQNLDRAEILIENIRKEALQMAEDLDNVYNSVDAVRTSNLMNNLSDVDKEDINLFANRIINRCDTVNIKVHTTRNDSQQNCLEEVNIMIDKIVSSLRENPDFAKAVCQSYIASCNPVENESGCKIFESYVLGCSLDDQKRIYKRLKGLYDYIVHTTYVVEFNDD